MEELGLCVETVVACDYAPGPQKFSKRNIDVKEFQPNLMLRQPSTAKNIDVYTAGFPCKPFSRLRNTTEWLEDKEAQQFWKVTWEHVEGPMKMYPTIFLQELA
jgi:site-specific DNA-cytosine methylase